MFSHPHPNEELCTRWANALHLTSLTHTQTLPYPHSHPHPHHPQENEDLYTRYRIFLKTKQDEATTRTMEQLHAEFLRDENDRLNK